MSELGLHKSVATAQATDRTNASNETDLLIPARPKILVVDDESAARTLLYIGLRRADFLVSQAASGVEAVEIYRQQQKDIVAVILDVSMPRRTGIRSILASCASRS